MHNFDKLHQLEDGGLNLVGMNIQEGCTGVGGRKLHFCQLQESSHLKIQSSLWKEIKSACFKILQNWNKAPRTLQNEKQHAGFLSLHKSEESPGKKRIPIQRGGDCRGCQRSGMGLYSCRVATVEDVREAGGGV